MESCDLLIIGAGPIGIAAAIQAKRENLNAIILDKGVVVNTIYNFPTNMTFFTTANLLEIGGHPFPSTGSKPTRQMALDYYRLIVQNEALDVRTYHHVTSVEGGEGEFTIGGKHTFPSGKDPEDFKFHAKYVMIATGYFDNPNGLDVPGADLPHVHLYYKEPHEFFRQNVVIIGAGNSGAEASLELFRFGAKVTLVHNQPMPKATVKYWVAPDLNNRLKARQIEPVMPANVTEITRDSVIAEYEGKSIEIPADTVFVFTGFTPDTSFFKSLGIDLEEDGKVIITKYFESNRDGLFVIGSAAFGKYTNSVFIENGRVHAKDAVGEISRRLKDQNYTPDKSPSTVVIRPTNI